MPKKTAIRKKPSKKKNPSAAKKSRRGDKGRVTERKLTEAIIKGTATKHTSPAGVDFAVDLKRKKGKRILGKLGPARKPKKK